MTKFNQPTKGNNMKKKLTVTLNKEEVINLSRLIYQDLESMKKLYKDLDIADTKAQKFGNKFLPKLLKFLDVKQPHEAA